MLKAIIETLKVLFDTLKQILEKIDNHESRLHRLERTVNFYQDRRFEIESQPVIDDSGDIIPLADWYDKKY